MPQMLSTRCDVRFSYEREILELDQYLAHWPQETVELVLTAMRDTVEEALQGTDAARASNLYALLSYVRVRQGRKYLRIFAGWPCSVPVGSKTVSDAKSRKMAPRRPTKPDDPQGMSGESP